jgi:general secretion pathway protein B
MSYILDALRRADAERERDPARGIHAQPAAVLPREAEPSRAPWVLAGAVVGMAAVVAGIYLFAAREPEPLVAPVVPSQPVAVAEAPIVPAVVPVATAVMPPPPPPMPAPVLERSPPRPTPAAAERTVKAPVVVARVQPVPPQPGVTSPGAVPPAGGAPAAPPAAQPASPPAPSTAPSTAPATAPSTAPRTGPSIAAPAAPGSAPPDRVVAVAELPADIQRELPKLVIAGGVHSDNPAQRMLIVGGQVRSEGAELAPGLVLEQIRANSAVLRFRGWRYSVSF